MLAVDVPFVSPALLEFLIARARNSPAQVTIVRSSRGWQPLCAVYRREFADLAEEALRQQQYRIDALFDPQTTQAVGEEELRAEGFSAEMFRNLNTREELAEAQSQVRAGS
jgi:molybdenum cofactor guanylyltransferase